LQRQGDRIDVREAGGGIGPGRVEVVECSIIYLIYYTYTILYHMLLVNI
jgi:hypothetical protein